ncbi:MAG: hypothetical protein QXO75_10630 [Nitrososphaerota archaeon]
MILEILSLAAIIIGTLAACGSGESKRSEDLVRDSEHFHFKDRSSEEEIFPRVSHSWLKYELREWEEDFWWRRKQAGEMARRGWDPTNY